MSPTTASSESAVPSGDTSIQTRRATPTSAATTSVTARSEPDRGGETLLPASTGAGVTRCESSAYAGPPSPWAGAGWTSQLPATSTIPPVDPWEMPASTTKRNARWWVSST